MLSLALASFVGPQPMFLLLLYTTINILYTMWLKHIVIVDVFCIAIMFVIRVFTGGAAVNIGVSSWLVMTTFLLALFLALAKRRQELSLFEGASIHRPVLDQYTPQLADEMMSLITPVILVTYILYTLSAETMTRFNSKMLYITSIYVVFGIMRYLYLVHRVNIGSDPTELIINDFILLAAILGWILNFYFIIYI